MNFNFIAVIVNQIFFLFTGCSFNQKEANKMFDFEARAKKIEEKIQQLQEEKKTAGGQDEGREGQNGTSPPSRYANLERVRGQAL